MCYFGDRAASVWELREESSAHTIYDVDVLQLCNMKLREMYTFCSEEMGFQIL
jgi:hypothetical protein